ncbi:OLC1v1036145C1 [Oldenlandia corymbosa var. corymbosa]|uniref:OLC1v1036145C1 n=1 Tax=Oldenlandia corymbosa var. corymbosa TaxID=529605 RepID=A0AAV1CUQ2_OLDCO|nr:OLC1v1036145C1 [Oldenlandia corymbosa var. corymbosa]
MAKQLGLSAAHLISLNWNKPNPHHNLGRIKPPINKPISKLKFKLNPETQLQHHANLKALAHQEVMKKKQQKKQLAASSATDNNIDACWIDLYVPEKARPYAYLLRLYESVAPWLVGWPYFLSLAMATETGALLDLKMLARFFLIAFMDRNILLTVNDLLDQDIDAKVIIHSSSFFFFL